MSYGMESSFSGVGNLRNEMQSALRMKADSLEVGTLKDTVSRMHNDIEKLRNRIEALEQKEATNGRVEG